MRALQFFFIAIFTILTTLRLLQKIKYLEGLLPICASCKKIRDDKGHWQSVEGFIRDRSGADFSHSLCPECAEKLYPEVDE